MNQESNPIVLATNDIMSERMAGQLKMALPEHITVEKFQRVVVTAINKNPDLLNNDKRTLLTACIECAQDGLLPDGKEAALVPFKGKIQYMPMVKGICKKAHNSGELPFLDMHVVHQNDMFDYELGLHPNLVHKPTLGERGDIIGAYAVARTTNGSDYIEVMSTEEIDYVRNDSSKSGGSGPWSKYYGEMARKTVLRRLSKRLPLSSDLSRVIERVDAMYAFEDRREAAHSDDPPPPRPQPSDFEQPQDAPTDMLPLIDDFGETMGEFSKPDFVTECVKKIEAFVARDRLEAFMEFNGDAIYDLGAKTEERMAVSKAYNDQVANLGPTAPEEGEEAPTEPPATEPSAHHRYAVYDADGKEVADVTGQVDYIQALTIALEGSDKPEAVWIKNSEAFTKIDTECKNTDSDDGVLACQDVAALANRLIQKAKAGDAPEAEGADT